MIGNDVIDIDQSRLESNWQREGLIQKLFTAEEQLCIRLSSDPEIALWLLWSMKEAAYKIHHRQTKIRAYIPKKLVCTLVSKNDGEAVGQVMCEAKTYHTKSSLHAGCIHTVATASIKDLNRIIEIEKSAVLKDENGIPYRFIPNQSVVQPVSISHHGRYEKVVAIALQP